MFKMLNVGIVHKFKLHNVWTSKFSDLLSWDWDCMAKINYCSLHPPSQSGQNLMDGECSVQKIPFARVGGPTILWTSLHNFSLQSTLFLIPPIVPMY